MRVYAVREDNNERVLYCIKCDGFDCDNEIKPDSKISESDWLKVGEFQTNGIESCNKFELDFCNKCKYRY